MKKYLLLIACLLFNWEVSAQTITRKGDTLIATPAKTYQWFKNGTVINGATNQKYVPNEKGNYTVRLGDVSDSFLYKSGKYATVTGLIYNKKLEPVTNASVEVNGIKTTTNANGKYQVRFPKTLRAIVRVNHPDYLNRSVGFLTTDGDTLYKDVLIDQFTVTHSYDATRATMLGTNVFTIIMPDSAVINIKTGTPYYGKVNVHLSAHQPGEVLFGEQMPGGDFLGVNKNGDENVLYSYGYFTCELRDEAGHALNLAPGKTASATFKPADKQIDRLLDSVPLWHFDDGKAVWVEKGITQRIGNIYTTEISHFSSWNCDWSGPRSWVEGEVIPCNVKNTVAGTVYADQIPVQVDSKGYYLTMVPAESEIDIFATNQTKEYTTPKLTAGEQHRAPLISVNELKGSGFVDSTGYLRIFHKGNDGIVNFSADSGKTFQATPEFQFKKKDNSPKFCVIRDAAGCEFRFSAPKALFFKQDCGRFSGNSMRTAYNLNELKEQIVNNEQIQELYFNIPNEPLDNIDYIYQYGRCISSLSINPDISPVNYEIINSLSQYLINLRKFKLYTFEEELKLDRLIWNKQLKYIDLTHANLSSLIPSVVNKWADTEGLNFALNNISSLPQEVGQWKQIQYLDLERNKITSLPQEVGQWKQIKDLRLGFNYLITSLPQEVGQWKQINTLNLDSTQLTTLPKEVGEWKAITELYLNNNQLTDLPKEVGQWTQLQYLDLGQNKITSLPQEVGQWKAVLSLFLGNNQLSSIPIEAGEWKQIAVLALSSNQLTYLPKEVGGWNSVTELYLNDNRLTSLPKESGEWKQIKNLDISRNQLISLPKESGEWKQIESLELKSNQLTTLPAEIGKWEQIYSLNLSNNLLSSIPSEISNCTQLSMIDISHNQLTSLPEEIGNCTQFTTINISNNKLSYLPDRVTWPVARTIDLSYNQITTLPPLTMMWEKVQTLNLSNNKLNEIPAGISNWIDLRELNLSHNKLNTLPEGANKWRYINNVNLSYNQFANFPEEITAWQNLDTLDLSNNQLSSLPFTIKSLSYLKKLNLSNNQLSSLPEAISEIRFYLLHLNLSGNNFLQEEKNKIQSWLPNTTIIW